MKSQLNLAVQVTVCLKSKILDWESQLFVQASFGKEASCNFQ